MLEEDISFHFLYFCHIFLGVITQKRTLWTYQSVI